MWRDLKVTRAADSRLAEVDFDALGFGNIFSDHMFSMTCSGGVWGNPQILPYGNIELAPGNATLHYGQSVFEGLKAFLGSDNVARVFRPDMNARRLLTSCERMCIPPLDEETFCAAIDELVALDHAWIPRKRGQALYVRPLIFSVENHLEVRPSNEYRFIIMTAPVRAYFDEGVGPIALKVEETYTRSAPGGIGAAKTAGNYAASLYPTQQGMQDGFVQMVWLDGIEHRYVEEVGAMNIFFRFKDRIVTPDLHGTILPGVTRDSVITLLRDAGHLVEERRVAIDEVVQSVHNGELLEVFGAGTAAIIAPVGKFSYKGEVLTVQNNQAGEITRWLYERLTDIQRGDAEDEYGWNRLISIDEPSVKAVTS
jgi:branched-chain amino acid aminotransferase